MAESRPLPDFTGIFTRERRVRFLDHLAINGNARAAAAHAGVSHDSAYRARRQDPVFAGLWDAALVHAREQSAAVLATRALDGVEIDVWYHGEVVGTRRVHDPRLLLAHMARLDRRVEGDKPAQARAERFDELLAGYAGQAAPDAFDCAVDEAGDTPGLPPTRAAYVAWLREAMTEDIDAGDGAACCEAAAEAEEAAGDEWDAWRAEGLALVGAIVEGDGEPAAPSPPSRPYPSSPRTRGPRFSDSTAPAAESGAPTSAGVTSEGEGEPPVEYKSARLGLPPRQRGFLPLDRVASVRPGVTFDRAWTRPDPPQPVTKSLWRGAGEAL